MFEHINMPERTVGPAAKRVVTATDCARVLLPLMAGWPGLPEFDDLTPDHLSGDARFAFHRWCDLGRMAIASDPDRLRKAVRPLASFMRGAVSLFGDYEFEPAKTWIASAACARILAHATRSTSR